MSFLFSTKLYTQSGQDSSAEDEELEDITSQVNSLKDDAESALLASDNIVKALQSFSNLMVRRLQSMEGNGGAVESVPQIEQTATDIKMYSQELSCHIEYMCKELKELVCMLEKLKVKEGKSLGTRIWGWLSIVFVVLSRGLTVVGVALPPAGTLGIVSSIASSIASSASSISSQMAKEGTKLTYFLGSG